MGDIPNYTDISPQIQTKSAENGSPPANCACNSAASPYLRANALEPQMDTPQNLQAHP
jgi:hypothetical protein